MNAIIFEEGPFRTNKKNAGEIRQFNLLANRLQVESQKLDTESSRGRMARVTINKLEVAA